MVQRRGRQPREENGEGMVAPIIVRVESQGLGSISKEIRGHLERITPNKAEVVEGSTTAGKVVGTVTVMNLGMYGVKSCALIIREPQTLVLGTAETRVVPREIGMDDAEGGGGEL